MTKTFLSEGHTNPCVVVSDPDGDGNVTVFAAEGASDNVKAFPAKKAPEGSGHDYEPA